MAEKQVTIAGVYTADGQNSKGPWTRWDVKDGSGDRYSTFNADLGRKLENAKGSVATLTFTEEQKGEYTNRTVTGVEVDGGAQQVSPSTGEVYPAPSSDETRQLRIMRQSALERALKAASLKIVPVENPAELYALSDAFIDYFIKGAPEGPL